MHWRDEKVATDFETLKWVFVNRLIARAQGTGVRQRVMAMDAVAAQRSRPRRAIASSGSFVVVHHGDRRPAQP